MTTLLLAGFAAVAAASAGPVDRPFPGGEISQLAIDDGPTQGSFSNVGYRYDDCGKRTGETTCTWQIDVGLAPEGFELCPSSLEASKTIWTSGEQSANGTVASGARSFALRGTPGQVLCVILTQTSSGEDGGWKFESGGSTILKAILMDQDLVTPVEAAELKIVRASTAAQVAPPPPPVLFAVSPNCRVLTIGAKRYAFLYRQMGCHKATNLAKMAHLSKGAPSGYRCSSKVGGGVRCSRQGHPRKFVEWRPPGDSPRRPR